MTPEKLEERLLEWADEYKGGLDRLGYSGNNILAQLQAHGGFVPSSAGYIPIPVYTAADEIEEAVRGMELIGLWREGRALRCEYFRRNDPEDMKLQHMRAIGCSVGRTAYYEAIKLAKAFLIGSFASGRKRKEHVSV